MKKEKLPLDQVIQGDCLEVMADLPAESIDLVFADPPYNLQLRQDLWRPNQTRVDAVSEEWDRFNDFAAYDDFTQTWLNACRRLLKPNGTLWVIGTYHNIHRVGTILQDMGFWVLNEVVWVKTNPMPNFRGVRFTNAHETLLWVQKQRGRPYTFNHHAMKALNGEKQMRSDWLLPICTGGERLRLNDKKAHPTQKPEALLYRIITASSNPGDVLLDPFFGTGTSGAVAKTLRRHFIGIERETKYVELARDRLAAVPTVKDAANVYFAPEPRRQPRIPFGRLLEEGLLQPGQYLFFRNQKDYTAQVMADGSLEYHGQRASIHKLAKQLSGAPANGWELWFYQDQTGDHRPIDVLRQVLREESRDGY